MALVNILLLTLAALVFFSGYLLQLNLFVQ